MALMTLELAGVVATLTLFGIAQPNLFRTRLWQVGYDNGFNSSPAQILYAYANHRPVPKTPFVWTETLTNFNVAVSVLALFVFLVKVVMFVLHIWYPILGAIVSAFITALWIVSIYGQMGPDHIDPIHPSNIAWYIGHSCEIARPSGNHHYCILAKASFTTTVFMFFVYVSQTILGIHSAMLSKSQRLAAKLDVDDLQMSAASDRGFTGHPPD
ncbi:hypothetical protein K3495_g12026 [Podosphaera aphanis]|nr:hypothetical protein K3495_g12026 [Podosphaera aphanis]